MRTSSRKSPSFSRTCPVTLTHPSTKKTVTGLAIIDDQANCTLIRPAVITSLELSVEQIVPTNQTFRTVDGKSNIKPCKEVKNLAVESLDGQTRIQILSCMTCEDLPNAIQEIPTLENVLEIYKDQELADNFPVINNDWKTIILIGRDCV